MKRNLLLFALLFAAMASWAGNFPFPSTATYAGGIKATLDQTTLQSRYTSWKQNHYEESGTLARVKFDTPNTAYTVSEGIGYGMLIFVQMDNSTNLTQDEFNKLWAYYQKYRDGNGLMNWKIDGFKETNNGAIVGANAATDAELDVALALVLAHYQWGSTGTVNYIKAAEDLIDLIYTKEVANNLLKPGDVWDDAKNPCYFSMAALKAFDVVQTKEGFTKTHDWASVITRSYTFLQAAQNDATGLYPDWCNVDGSASSGRGYDYSYDACRTPWRVVWDYVWWGNTTAQTLSGVTASWAKNINPGSVVDGYKIDGTSTGKWNNSCFIGGLGAAFMCNAQYQTQLNNYYSQLLSKQGEAYYSATTQLIYALLMSGNTVNPLAAKSAAVFNSAASSTDGATIVVSTSKSLSTIAANEASKFTVMVNGSAVSVSSVALNASDNKQIVLTLSTAIKGGDKIFISYTGTGITDADAFKLTTFTAQTVANKVPGGSTVFIDFKKGATSILGTSWFTFNDATPGGASKITPLTSPTSPFTCTAPGYGGTDSAAKVSFTLNSGSLTYPPFIGMGIAMSKPEAAFDLSSATAISFMYKGPAATLEINLSTITNDQNFAAAISACTNWTKITLPLNTATFAQPNWGGGTIVTWDASKIVKFQWKVQTTSGTTGEMWVDDVTFENITISAGASVNITALQAAINAASTTYNTTTEGTAVGQYLPAVRATLQSAITAAGNTVATATTQAEVNAAVTTLNTAVATYLTKANLDLTQLQAAIAASQGLHNQAVEGTANGNYKSGSKATYQTAINAAQTALTATTQAAVNNALIALGQATSTFTSNRIGFNYADLNATLTQALQKYSLATEGTAIGQYQVGAKAALSAAMATAQNANIAATQADVDAAVNALKAAIASFDSKLIKPNTASLQSAITAAEALYDGATEGTASGTYKFGSKDVYNTAIVKAKNTLASATTQTAIDAALTELNTATATFNGQKNTKSGVKEFAATRINTYPNPAVANITIDAQTPIENISLINLNGDLLTSIVAGQTDKLSVSVENLASGSYIILVRMIDGSVESKIFTK